MPSKVAGATHAIFVALMKRAGVFTLRSEKMQKVSF